MGQTLTSLDDLTKPSQKTDGNESSDTYNHGLVRYLHQKNVHGNHNEPARSLPQSRMRERAVTTVGQKQFGFKKNKMRPR